jgi:hypothetical protein
MHIGILISFNNHENLKILKKISNIKMDIIFNENEINVGNYLTKTVLQYDINIQNLTPQKSY